MGTAPFAMRIGILTGILAFVPFVSSLTVINTQHELAVKAGNPVTLQCQTDAPWRLCKWSHKALSPGHCTRTPESIIRFCQIDAARPDAVRWVGGASEVCAITINAAAPQDDFSWTCQLLGDDDVPAAHTVNVVVYEQTDLRFATRPPRTMTLEEQSTIECDATGGTPKPEVTAFVGPGPELDDADEPLVLVTEASDGMEGGTVSRMFSYEPKKTDQGMYVKCVAEQKNVTGSLVFDRKWVSSPFHVVFKPMWLDEPIGRVYVTEGGEAEVNIVFDASPAPSAEQVVWHMVGQSTNESVVLEAGQQTEDGILEASYLEIRGIQVSASLRIHQVSPSLVDNLFYLEATNEHGTTQYKFELTFDAPEVTTEPYIEPEPETGMSTGAIVGIVIVILLTLVAFVSVFFYSYKNGKWCFDNKLPKEYMSVQQRDIETQNMAASAISGSGSRDEVDDDRSSPLPEVRKSESGKKGRESYMIATSGDRYQNRESNYPVQ